MSSSDLPKKRIGRQPGSKNKPKKKPKPSVQVRAKALREEFASALPPVGKTYCTGNKPFPMTMEQEMALGIVLWRAARFHYANLPRVLVSRMGENDPGVLGGLPRNDEEVNETAIRMAKRMGVVDEFWAWLFEFPAWKLFVVGLDPWPTRLIGLVPPDREVVTVSPPLPARGVE